MVIKTTDKMNFRERPDNDAADLFVKQFWKEQGNKFFDMSSDFIPEETMLDIVAHATSFQWSKLIVNKHASAKVLEKILEYEYGYNTACSFAWNILNHSNVTSGLVETIFEAFEDDKNDSILSLVANNKKVPGHVLVKLLPNENSKIGDGSNSNYELAACFNPNTPMFEALYTTQWLADKKKAQQLWDKKFKSFVVFMKIQRNVDLSEYPVEWVQELVWNKAVG